VPVHGCTLPSNFHPIRGLYRLWGFHVVEANWILDNRFMKVVGLSALSTGLLNPQRNAPGTRSVRGWVNPSVIVQPEFLCQWKISITTWGIEPATFWFVEQRLNQLSHSVPPLYEGRGFRCEIMVYSSGCSNWFSPEQHFPTSEILYLHRHGQLELIFRTDCLTIWRVLVYYSGIYCIISNLFAVTEIGRF